MQIQANHPCLSSRAKASGSIAGVHNLVAITRHATLLCGCGAAEAAEGKSGAHEGIVGITCDGTGLRTREFLSAMRGNTIDANAVS
jgi:hypothetical protein